MAGRQAHDELLCCHFGSILRRNKPSKRPHWDFYFCPSWSGPTFVPALPACWHDKLRLASSRHWKQSNIDILHVVSNTLRYERLIKTANFMKELSVSVKCERERKRYIDGSILVRALHRDISDNVIVPVRNFRSLLENAMNFRLLFWRNNAQDIARRRSNFRAKFLWKFAGTKQNSRISLSLLLHHHIQHYSPKKVPIYNNT